MQFVRHYPLTNRFARFHSFARADLHKFPQGARDLCPTLKLCSSPSSSCYVGSQVDLHNTGWISWRILDAAFAKIIQIFVKCVLGIRFLIVVAKISIIFKWISLREGCSWKNVIFLPSAADFQFDLMKFGKINRWSNWQEFSEDFHAFQRKTSWNNLS